MTKEHGRYQLWERLMNILRRFVEAEDEKLSDDAFIRKVFKRYKKARKGNLIDPAE